MEITGVQLFQKITRVSADAKLKRFQKKILKAMRKPTINKCEFRLAQFIAQPIA